MKITYSQILGALIGMGVGDAIVDDGSVRPEVDHAISLLMLEVNRQADRQQREDIARVQARINALLDPQ